LKAHKDNFLVFLPELIPSLTNNARRQAAMATNFVNVSSFKSSPSNANTSNRSVRTKKSSGMGVFFGRILEPHPFTCKIFDGCRDELDVSDSSGSKENDVIADFCKRLFFEPWKQKNSML
jgi:hypothetical protein